MVYLRSKNYLPLEFNVKSSARPDSIPFISGDTFRSWSDFAIEPGGKPTSILELPTLKSTTTVFIKVDILLKKSHINSILQWLRKYDFEPCEGPTFIIHNGDLPPTDQTLEKLAALGAKIFCVNKAQETDYIRALPIGLENAHFNKSGVVSNFLEADAPILIRGDSQEKETLIFAAFNSSTNKAERISLIEQINNSRHQFLGSSLPPDIFRKSIEKSFFVLSPQGNGLDCHRTWEAIYLGAVPVVKKGTLAERFTTNLPIFEVDNWGEILKMSDEDLLSTFLSLKSRNIALAFSEYWQQQLLQ